MGGAPSVFTVDCRCPEKEPQEEAGDGIAKIVNILSEVASTEGWVPFIRFPEVFFVFFADFSSDFSESFQGRISMIAWVITQGEQPKIPARKMT